LTRDPYIGRRRDADFHLGLRSFPAGDYLILHRIAEDGVVLILHVVHGSQDLATMFGR
jgi:plasmid stabilization system protein ParE